MDNNFLQKSVSKDLPDSQKQFYFKAEKDKTFLNIIIQGEKQQLSANKSFTPTRKQSLIKNDPITPSSQCGFSHEFSFKTQEKFKRQEIITKINQLETRVKKLQKIQAKISQAKRIRRKSSEITKLFTCPDQGCKKHYGTETALKKHIQIKHSKKASTKIQSLSSQK